MEALSAWWAGHGRAAADWLTASFRQHYEVGLGHATAALVAEDALALKDGDVEDGDIGGKEAVQRFPYAGGGLIGIGGKVGNLSSGVHAGVGAPGSYRSHRLAQQGRQGGSEFALDRASVRLDLPPDESGAVIFQGHPYPASAGAGCRAVIWFRHRCSRRGVSSTRPTTTATRTAPTASAAPKR